MARQYQVLCRDFLQRRHLAGAPYNGDGIDVPFEAAGTTWHMDIALQGLGENAGGILLAECRRTQAPQQQSDVGAFAYQVEKIREALGIPVAGVFMVMSEPQIGALKVVAADAGLSAVLLDGLELDDAKVAFLRYDAGRERRLHDYIVFLKSGAYELRGRRMGMMVTRNDGSTEYDSETTERMKR